MKKKFIVIYFLFLSFKILSQNLVVTPQTATYLINNVLLGNGLTATNITSKGGANQIGTFSGGFSLSPGIPFLLDQGIILTSGSITDLPGNNTSGATSTAAGGVSDVDLQAIIQDQSNKTTDVGAIEFDFVATSDTIGFRYVFASEEYPEFACGGFNDVFAFFLTGPSPSGVAYNKKNIALIPNTNTPVSVNTVNAGVFGSQGNAANCDLFDVNWRNYSNYYHDNPKNSSTIKIKADGYTSVFTAGAKVVCGETYHIKLAIADVGYSDNGYDSYVFLEAKSFVSPGVKNTSTIKDLNGNVLTNNYITEGCSEAVITFNASPAPTSDYTVNYTLTGSATKNTDYTIPASAIIPANQTSTSIKITPTKDNTSDDGETIIINLSGACNTAGSATTITIKDELKITASKTSDPTCSVANTVNSDGVITLTATGGATPYTFSLDNGTSFPYNSSPISTLGNGTYSIKVKDKDGCIAADLTAINLNKSCSCVTPSITTTKTNPSTCTGTDGKITISGLINGSTYTLSYVKDGGSPTTSSITASGTTYDINSLGKGDYTKINVTNSGCTSNDETETLSDPSGIIITSTKTDPTNCSGTDGKITISGLTNGKTYTLNYVKDGGSPTTSSITASGTTYDITSLGKGDYTKINVINSGCTSNDETETLTDPSGISITSTKTDPTSCGGTDGKITISGLTNGSTYTLSYVKDGSSPITSPITASATTYDITSLGKGDYTKINVTNSGCTSNDETETLSDPSGITITSTKTDPTTCSGTDGKITISGLTNGSTYTLSYVKDGGSPTTSSITASGTTYDINSLGKGDYTKINVTNSGCTSNDETETLSDPSGIIITSTKTDPTNCSGTDGKITISGLTNGKTYTLNYVKDGGSPTTSSITASGTTYDITSLGKGDYTKINVINSGCTSNDETETLTDPSGISITSTKTDPTSCGGTDGKITISGLTNGSTYTLSYVKDGSSPITSPITASATTYDITSLGKGDYTKINVTNSGCTSNDETETLSDPSGITITSTKTDPTTCSGTDGKITISGLTNGSTYTLSYVKDGVSPTTSSFIATGTFFDIVNIGKGIYTKINVTNAGCTSNDETQTLIDPSGILITSSKNDPTICGGMDGSITISGLTNGNTYSLSYVKNNTSTINSTFAASGTTYEISNLGKGVYSKIHVIESGCASNDEIQTIINPAGPASPKANLTQPTCTTTTGKIEISAPLGNYTYSIDGTNFQVSTVFNSLTANTTYKIIVQNLGGCKDSSNFKIDTILSTPSNAKFTLKNASCISSTGLINVTSPIGSFYTYSIDGTTFQTTTSFTNLNPGNYTLTTKNLSGCSNTNSITIKTPPSPPSKPFAIVKQPNCDSVTGTITVVNPAGNNYSYSLDNLNYQNSPKFSSKPAGNYTYYVRDTTLCFSSNTITVQPQPTLPIASFSYTPTTDLTIINTQIVFSNNSLNATTYKWNFDDDSKFSNEKNPVHEFPGIANVYFVKLTAYNELCADDTTIAITIIEKPIIYIPNSFTPNTDEINNSFVPVIAGGISPDNYSLYIFNRWGTLLFESHNKEIGWDGTYGNKVCQPDTYIWKIEYKESTDSKLRKQLVGHVNLIN